jgi:hypothetical protein
MSRRYTEAEYVAVVAKRAGWEKVERVGGGVDARHATAHSGSSHEAAIQQTKSRRGESAPSPYRSKWEAAFASKLELEKRAGLIKAYKYEGISLQLSKGQYHRPDFLIWHLDGSIEISQVKGWHKNMRAGTKGLKWAAQLHPWFTWTLKRWTGKGWDSNYVEI